MKKIVSICLIAICLLFASCTDMQKSGAASGSDTTATAEKADKGEGYNAVVKLVSFYKMKVAASTSCEGIKQNQTKFANALDDVYSKYEDMSTSDKLRAQEQITSLGMAVSQKQSELGCK